MADLDPGTFWRLMGARPVAVPVVAARGPDGPAGLLALSVSHVTASSPSMLVSVGAATGALAAIRASGAFAISYLPEGSEDIAETFGGRRGISGAHRFAGSPWIALRTGSPVLESAVAAFDCTVAATFVHADTQIIVGTIVAWSVSDDAVPMITHHGRYRGLG
jgi:flavin reductase (DIM6/NTAB) family NADH-FMN oxidoreductase RutF